MPKCVLHPGRESVASIFGKNYCQLCQGGVATARSRVDKHVQPKDCFIWYVSNDNWQPVTGTGCAHWVSHQRNVQAGALGDRCLSGFTYRVPVFVRSRTPVAGISQVKVDDIWAAPALDHTGLVIRVVPPARAGGPPSITIRHDSSRRGGVAENDFATYFNGRGSFYR